MNQTGKSSVKQVRLVTKTGINIPKENIDINIARLTNQIWKLLPMRENKEDWERQLNTVLIEIAGLAEIFRSIPQFLQLWSKLEGLKIVGPDFEIYRKTVFETLSLLSSIKNGL